MDMDLAYKTMGWLIGAFAGVMLAMGHYMSPEKNGLQEMAKAKACAGFVVFNGKKVPKCGDDSK